jgi:hypothetical protein
VLVDGCLEKTIELSNYQTRDKDNALRQKFFWFEQEALAYDKGAKKATSYIKPLIYCKETNQTLIQVKIHTGRMHQIRLQLEALGFPLTGELLYRRDSVPMSSATQTFTFIRQRTKLGDEYKKVPVEKTNYVADYKDYLGIQVVEELEKSQFEKVLIEIFGSLGYSLKANFLSFYYNSKSWVWQLTDIGQYLSSQKYDSQFFK